MTQNRQDTPSAPPERTARVKKGLHRTGSINALCRVLYQGWTPERTPAEFTSSDVQHAEAIARFLNRRTPEITAHLVRIGALNVSGSPCPHSGCRESFCGGVLPCGA